MWIPFSTLHNPVKGIWVWTFLRATVARWRKSSFFYKMMKINQDMAPSSTTAEKNESKWNRFVCGWRSDNFLESHAFVQICELMGQGAGLFCGRQRSRSLATLRPISADDATHRTAVTVRRLRRLARDGREGGAVRTRRKFRLSAARASMREMAPRSASPSPRHFINSLRSVSRRCRLRGRVSCFGV